MDYNEELLKTQKDSIEESFTHQSKYGDIARLNQLNFKTIGIKLNMSVKK